MAPRRRPALTASELRRLPADYREAARLCARWEGQRVGDTMKCRSALVGRRLTLRARPRAPLTLVEVVGCAVPRSDRKTKRCRADYLVARVLANGSMGTPVVVDGGRVRNASRTPRPMHRLEDPRLTTDRDAPYFYRQFEMIQRENVEQGLPRMADLDLAYPHRVGSSRCCPQHPENPVRLMEDLRWASEGPGIDRPLARRILALGHHLRDKHRVRVVVPETLGPDDEAAARRILRAADDWCGDSLTEWEQHAKMEAEERRLRRKKGKRRSTTSADKKKRLHAERAAQGHTRSQVIRAIAKDARRRAA